MELMKRDVRYVSLDTETTGFKPQEGHRIVEIGIVEFMNGLTTGRFFHTLCDPERDVPDEARSIHGHSTEKLQGQPKFADKVEEMLDFIDGAEVVIHNAPFDLAFLDAEMAIAGLPPFSGRFKVKDSLKDARTRFPRAQNTLDDLCRRYRVDASSRTLHGALIDADLLAQAYMKMAGADGLAHAFEVKAAVERAAVVEGGVVKLPVRENLGGGEPTDEEIARHAELVGKLKNPLWAAMPA